MSDDIDLTMLPAEAWGLLKEKLAKLTEFAEHANAAINETTSAVDRWRTRLQRLEERVSALAALDARLGYLEGEHQASVKRVADVQVKTASALDTVLRTEARLNRQHGDLSRLVNERLDKVDRACEGWETKVIDLSGKHQMLHDTVNRSLNRGAIVKGDLANLSAAFDSFKDDVLRRLRALEELATGGLARIVQATSPPVQKRDGAILECLDRIDAAEWERKAALTDAQGVDVRYCRLQQVLHRILDGIERHFWDSDHGEAHLDHDDFIKQIHGWAHDAMRVDRKSSEALQKLKEEKEASQ